MKNGKFGTQAEIYQALIDGKKIHRVRGNVSNQFKYVHLIEGNLISADGHSVAGSFFSNEWEIYKEYKPKKKITLYTHTVKYINALKVTDGLYEEMPPTTRSAEDVEKIMLGVKVVSTTSKEIEVDDA